MATRGLRRPRGSRVAFAAIALVAAVVSGSVGAQPVGWSTTAAAAASSTVTSAFQAEADARVEEANPTTNYGSSTTLNVDTGTGASKQSYLRFTVSGISGTVQLATLRVYSKSATNDGPSVSATSNDWLEGAVTWNDRPGPTSGPVDDTAAIATGVWVELDVTPLVSGNGTVSFVLLPTSSDGVGFNSRESASQRPELVVESLTSGAPASTSPPTVSGAPQEGETLTAAPGTWNGLEPMTLAFQWQKCDASGGGCADIAGATGQTYLLGEGDGGSTLRVVVTATNDDGSGTATSAPSGVVLGAGDVVIAGAGDIVRCDRTQQEATAQLLDAIQPTRVVALGDNTYPDGTYAEFTDCYDPTWGRHKARTHPVPGNHEYITPGASGYFTYFGAAAGDPSKGYYAVDLGSWRLYALNSNCSAAGGCGAGSLQEQWLRAELAAHPRSCNLAFLHHPRYASGDDRTSLAALYQAFYDAGGDIWLAGHIHYYERLARLGPTGAIDPNGIRTFVVGTGGASLSSLRTPMVGSEAMGRAHGVLELTLRQDGFDWQFVPIPGATFTDSGTDTCGASTSPTNQAPTVNAGPDQMITLPSSASLSGSASDDGLPNPPGALTTTWSKVSGPGTVTFGNANALATTATFSQDGTYVIRLTASDGALSSLDELTVTVGPAPSQNQAPTVSAGPDQTITLPAFASLDGTVSDDGLPNPPGAVMTTWTKQSGPGTVTFADASAVDTTASFSQDGTYVIRLTASDGALSSFDELTVTVNPAPPSNQAPTVNAGPDQTITLPADATLDGTVTDDGLPSGTLTTTWTKVSGPGTVTFADASAVDTTASFSQAGTYVLQLEASDGALSASDTATITVDPAPPQNQAPTVNAGPDQTITLPADATLDGTVTDDGLPSGTLTATWTKQSGPGTVTFADASAVDTTASFSEAGTYVLRLTASDGALSSFDELTVTVNPAPPQNQAPTVNAGPDQTITLPADATLDGTVTDDGLPSGTLTTTWTKVSGPGTVAFADASAVDTAATFSQAGTYVLQLEASDGALSASDTVTITVDPVPLPDPVFADGFESGDFSAWSPGATGGSDLSVTTAAALVGSYGMEATIASNSAIFVTDDSPIAESRYRARFYFHPNSIPMAKNNAHYIFQGLSETGAVVARVELRWNGSQYQLRAALGQDSNAFTTTGWFAIAGDASHWIELDWSASSAPGTNSGSLSFWIDDTESARAELTGIDNDTRRIESVRLGALDGIDKGTRGTYYFDDLESRRSSFIGPAPTSSSLVSSSALLASERAAAQDAHERH